MPARTANPKAMNRKKTKKDLAIPGTLVSRWSLLDPRHPYGIFGAPQRSAVMTKTIESLFEGVLFWVTVLKPKTACSQNRRETQIK